MWSEQCKPLTLSAQLRTVQQPAERIDILLTLAHFYTYDERSTQLLNELAPLIDKHPECKRQQAHFHLLLACQTQSRGEWDNSSGNLEKAHKIYKDCKDVRGEVETKIRVATMRAANQRYEEATFLLDECRELSEQYSLPPICHAMRLNHLAMAYMLMGLYDVAETYADQAYANGCTLSQTNEGVVSKNAVRMRSGPKWTLARTLGFCKRFDEALRHAEEGLAIVQPLNVSYWSAMFLAEVASALTGSGDAKQAIERLAPTISQLPSGQERTYAECIAALGMAYFAEERYEEAEPELRRAVDLYTQLNSIGPTKPECIGKLSKIAAAQGDYERALAYSEEHSQAVTRLRQSQHDQRLIRLTAVHEYTLKKQETDTLQAGNEKLAAANQLLQKAYEEQAELLNIVVHDIYNPLTIISLQTSLATKYAQKSEMQRVVACSQKIGDSARFISEIVAQLETMARLDGDQLDFTWQEIQLHSVLKQVAQRNQPLANAKSIEIKLEGDEAVRVRADIVSLHQVIDNMLSNSIKYSWPNSTVHIKLWAANGKVHVDFVDAGVGIDEAELSDLFSKFGRLASSQPTAHERSTGLGLYNAQKMAQLLGGEIRAHSAGLNQGTTFTLSLPMHGSTKRPQPVD